MQWNDVGRLSPRELDIARARGLVQRVPPFDSYKHCSYRVRSWQHAKLRAIAFARGVTISTLVVEALDAYLT